MKVRVALALPSRQEVVEVELGADATVADALAASGAREKFPEVDWDRVQTGIWSRPCAADARLREGDRVEVYRELVADPKERRRERAATLKPSKRPRSAP